MPRIPVKPPATWRVDPLHRLGRGLRLCLPLSAGAGRIAYDAGPAAQHGTLVDSRQWRTGPYGPYLGFVGGLNQYVNAGPLSWLSGAPAFTLVAITKRVTAGDNLPIGLGATLATTVGISGDTNISCRIGSGSGDVYSNTANTTTARQHIVMAFDGSQGTAINRVALYIDGVPQTLTMGSGTFPATAPTSSASVWIGAMEAVSFFGTGECDGVWWYDRTFSQADAIEHYADPFGMLTFDDGSMPPGLEPWMLGATLLPRHGPTVENRDPEAGATGARAGDRISFDWVPYLITDAVRLSSIRAWVNGVEMTGSAISKTSLGGGAYHVEVSLPLNDWSTYTVTTMADTDSTAGDPTTVAWSFATAISSDEAVAAGGFIREIAAEYGELAGATNAFVPDLVFARGSTLEVLPDYLTLGGTVSPPFDLAQMEMASLQGWITEFRAHPVPAWLLAGEASQAFAAAAVDVERPDAPVARAPVALDAETHAGQRGGVAALEVEIATHQANPAVLQAGEPARAEAAAAIDVTGSDASGLVVVDSPSLEWDQEGEN